jgi:threonine/homoserine/homoserine lactone efflux protein
MRGALLAMTAKWYSMLLFLKGILIGLSVAAPVGPMAILCVQRTLTRGRSTGFATGLGIATADGFYATVAAFGWTFLATRLLELQTWMGLGGGFLLLALGARVLLMPVPKPGGIVAKGSLWTAALSSFLLTLANPPTLLLFLAFFSTLGDLAQQGGEWSPLILSMGVFSGSLIWWLALSLGVSLGGRQLNAAWSLRINRLSGLVIIAFALAVLVRLLQGAS